MQSHYGAKRGHSGLEEIRRRGGVEVSGTRRPEVESELDAARHVYEKAGFRVVEKKEHGVWAQRAPPNV